MKNIYQSVLDEAAAKRGEVWEPSPKLLKRVEEYRREQEARRASELLNVKVLGRG